MYCKVPPVPANREIGTCLSPTDLSWLKGLFLPAFLCQLVELKLEQGLGQRVWTGLGDPFSAQFSHLQMEE